jgi:hypothetical protein
VVIPNGFSEGWLAGCLAELLRKIIIIQRNEKKKKKKNENENENCVYGI